MSKTKCNASKSLNLFASSSNRNSGAPGSKLITLSLFSGALPLSSASSVGIPRSGKRGMDAISTDRSCMMVWMMDGPAWMALKDLRWGRALGERVNESGEVESMPVPEELLLPPLLAVLNAVFAAPIICPTPNVTRDAAAAPKNGKRKRDSV